MGSATRCLPCAPGPDGIAGAHATGATDDDNEALPPTWHVAVLRAGKLLSAVRDTRQQRCPAVQSRALYRAQSAASDKLAGDMTGSGSANSVAPLVSNLVSSRGDKRQLSGTAGDTGRHEDSVSGKQKRRCDAESGEGCRLTFNQWVVGSSPTRVTSEFPCYS